MVDGIWLVKEGDEVITEQIAEGRSLTTRFQLASVSKQFTATAVLVLAQAGRLRLDDPQGALRLFKSNWMAGLLLFAGLAAGAWRG